MYKSSDPDYPDPDYPPPQAPSFPSPHLPFPAIQPGVSPSGLGPSSNPFTPPQYPGPAPSMPQAFGNPTPLPDTTKPSQNPVGNAPALTGASMISGPIVHMGITIEPFDGKATTKHQALKAIGVSSPSGFASVLLAYISSKSTNENNRLWRSPSRPEICIFNHIIHKLELLSSDVLSSDNIPRQDWVHALALMRSYLFLNMYNLNDIVRCFAPPGVTSTFPQTLDEYALGQGPSWPGLRGLFGNRGNFKPANFNASWELLAQVRTVFLVDDSGSMNLAVGGGADGIMSNQSRWNAVGDLLSHVAPIVTTHAAEGLDIHFLNHYRCYPGLTTAHDVNRTFSAVRPGGGTFTGKRVNDILDAYLSTLRYDRSLKALNLIVFTDGESSDEETLHRAIEEHVTKVVHRGYPAHQLGIEFVQVGDDADATRHLIKLEEEVSRHHLSLNRDVVGVTPTVPGMVVNADQTLAILVSGIDARMSGYMRQRRVNV